MVLFKRGSLYPALSSFCLLGAAPLLLKVQIQQASVVAIKGYQLYLSKTYKVHWNIVKTVQEKEMIYDKDY